MLIGTLKKIAEFCSLKAPQEITRNKWKGGFTIVELMVVILIVNLLSGVAIPKCTELIEKSREKIDLLKFYYLRDALNRALYEDDAFRIDESAKCGTRGENKTKEDSKNNKDSLSRWLATEEGVSLFIIEFHDQYKVNYQGENWNRTKDDQNMCGLLSSDGFWSQAFKEAGFGAITDIIYARAKGAQNVDQFKGYPGDYVAEKASNGWTRTYPKTPIFESKVLNKDPNAKSGNNGQHRYSMKIRWTNRNPDSHTLEVFLGYNGSTNVRKSRLGTCFSTDQSLCK